MRTLLLCLGEDITREGLADTPKRVAKALLDTVSGYHQTAPGVLGTALFHEPCVSQGGGGIVLVREIDFASTSTTTLLPFHGQVHIAYVPSGGVVLGLSKLVRLTKLFAKRLQTQQGLGQDIAIALAKQLKSCGAAVVISARHLTLLAAEPPGLHTTVCVDGSFTGKPELLQEALCLLGLDIQALTPDQIHSTAAAAPHLQPELTQEHDSEAGVLSAEALQGPSTPDCSEKDSERDCMLSDKGCESEKEADTEPQGLCHVSRRELSAVFRSTSGFDLSLDSRCASPAVPSSTCSTCCGIPAFPLLLPACGCGCPPEVQSTTACNLASMQLPGGSCECAAADRRAAMRTAVMVMLKEALGSSLPSSPWDLPSTAAAYVDALLHATQGYSQPLPLGLPAALLLSLHSINSPAEPPCPITSAASPSLTAHPPPLTPAAADDGQTPPLPAGPAGGGVGFSTSPYPNTLPGRINGCHTAADSMAIAGNIPASSRLSSAQGCEAAAGGCLRSSQVFLTALPFHSLCEHHMLPFYGSAHVLYTMHPSPAHPSLPNPSPSGPRAQPLATAPPLLHQDGCITGVSADVPPSPRQQHCNSSCGRDEEVGLYPETALLPAQHSTQGAFTVPCTQQQAEVALQASPPCQVQLSPAPCAPSAPAALEVLPAPAPVAGMLQHLLQALTQRLQVQERITHQLADTAWQLLGPEIVESVVVVVDAAHMCMVARGVENHAGHTTSVAARGKALQDSQLRRVAISAARAGFTALRPTTV